MRNETSLSRAGRDRWLLSYADLVTLLFACFTTAYAAAHVQSAETPVASKPEVKAAAALTQQPKEPLPLSELRPATEPATTSLRDVLTPVLTDSPAIGQLETIQDGRGLVISLPESATFSSGSADLTPAAEMFLMRMADALRGLDVRIRVEGHTDDRPISGGRYGSNWELSTARASAVVVFLVTEASFAPEHLSAAGYGEFHPRAANDLPESRALNRRVDVVVLQATASTALDWVAAP